ANAGIFVDGVYINSPASSLDVENLERVEIVKGPQSAQFGRGTLAGAVNYVTRRPTDTLTGRLQATGTTLDEYEVNGFISGPVSDSLSLLGSFIKREKNSEFFNAYENRKDMGGKNLTAFTGAALWEPAQNLSFYLRGSYADTSNDNLGIYTQGPEFNNCNLSTARKYYCGEIEIDYDNIRALTIDPNFLDGSAGMDREDIRVALLTDWEVAEGHLIQSITSFQSEDSRFGSDATNRAIVSSVLLPRGAAVDISYDTRTISQELRYNVEASDRLSFLLGGYFYDSYQDEVATYIPEDRGRSSEQSLAAFGSVELGLTDKLSLTGEVRYQHDTVELDAPTVYVKSKFDAVLPRVTLSYNATDNFMLYAIYAKGNKPGSVNTRLLSQLAPELIPIDEEKNDMYEVGLKASALDRRLNFQLSGYYFDWTNQQLTQQCEPPQCLSAVTYTDNLGKTEIIGAEADLAFTVVPDFWDMRFTAAYVDAEIKYNEVVGSASVEEEAAAFGFPVDPVDGDGIIVSGTPAPASPDFTFSATNNITAPLGDTGFEVFFRTDYAYVSEQFASIFGQASTGDRHNLNMRLGLQNQSWRFEVFAQNLTDDKTPLSLVRTIRFDGSFSPFTPNPSERAFSAIIPEGRKVGVTATYNF
ncbi:MAG: TonB-dependent receptor, partial [Parvularculaceae bacterium]|nr:TonB-dependent receptor [Parvularculaceae bacterium]